MENIISNPIFTRKNNAFIEALEMAFTTKLKSKEKRNRKICISERNMLLSRIMFIKIYLLSNVQCIIDKKTDVDNITDN